MNWPFFIPIGVLLLLPIPAVLRSIRKRKAEREGKVMVGTVRSVDQTGRFDNNQPQLRVLLDVKDASGAIGEATLKQTFLLTDMPSRGDIFAVVLNPKNPKEAFLANQQAMQRDDRTAAVLRDIAATPANMRNNPTQVGDIVAITPVGDGTDSYQVNVLHLGQAPSPVFCQQAFPDGHPYSVGDRVYLVTDNQTPPRTGYIMPLSFSGGERLLSTGNRADMLLADVLLYSGAKAQGTLLAFSRMSVPEAYASRNVSKWSLEFHIQPDDGSSSYNGSCTLGVISQEHAAMVTKVGMALPLRYDPYDKPTFVVDGIALGFGDPASIRKQMKQLHLAEQAGR